MYYRNLAFTLTVKLTEDQHANFFFFYCQIIRNSDEISMLIYLKIQKRYLKNSKIFLKFYKN